MSASDSADPDSFGKALRRYRQAAGLSLENVAYELTRLGVNKNFRTIHDWEKHDRGPRNLSPGL